MRVFVALALVAAAAGAACGAALVQPAPVRIAPADDPQLNRVAEAVSEALAAPAPDGRAAIPRELQLLSVDRRRDGTIVLDFNSALLMSTTPGALDDTLDQIMSAAAAGAGQSRSDGQFHVLVEGVAVDSYRPPEPGRPDSP